MIAMSVIRGTLVITLRPGGEQRGGHQLQRRVLRADHVHGAGQPGATATRMTSTSLTADRTASPGPPPPASRRVRPRRDRQVGIRRLCVMAVHLTRIYTKTGDAGTTRLGNNEQVAEDRSADRRVRRRRRVQRGDRRRARAGRPRRGAARRAGGRCRTTCSTSAPTCPPRSSRSRSTRRCGSPRSTSTRLEGWCDEYNARLPQARLLHPPRRHRGRGAAARGPDGRPARRTGGVGAGEPRSGTHQPAPGKVSQPALRSALHPVKNGKSGRRRDMGAGRQALNVGAPHHVEVWVPDSARRHAWPGRLRPAVRPDRREPATSRRLG